MSIRLIRASLLAALPLAAMMAGEADAHAVLEPRTAVAGSYQKVTVRITHGCEGSATIRVVVRIPDGVFSVRPQMKPGWDIAIKREKLAAPIPGPHGSQITERVTEVTWSGGKLPDEFFDEFGLQTKLPDEPVGKPLYFPVDQFCEVGQRLWNETPPAGHEGHHHLSSPAPSLILHPKSN